MGERIKHVAYGYTMYVNGKRERKISSDWLIQERPSFSDCEAGNPYWLRKNEILGVTWEQVDLAKDLGFNARITLYDTRNGEPRGVPLNKDAVAVLSEIGPDPAKREGSVFKRENGEDWGQIRTAFEKAVERADLPDFRFHDLRHTCASHMAMRGRPLKEIQEVLGHKSFSMTLRYAHLSPMHLRTAVESLDGLTSIDNSLKMTHKMTHNAKNERLDEIPSAK